MFRIMKTVQGIALCLMLIQLANGYRRLSFPTSMVTSTPAVSPSRYYRGTTTAHVSSSIINPSPTVTSNGYYDIAATSTIHSSPDSVAKCSPSNYGVQFEVDFCVSFDFYLRRYLNLKWKLKNGNNTGVIITVDAKSQVYYGTNATDILDFYIPSTNENITITVCPLNYLSLCQVITTAIKHINSVTWRRMNTTTLEFTCELSCRSRGVYGCVVVLNNHRSITGYSYVSYGRLQEIAPRYVTIVFNDVDPMMPHNYSVVACLTSGYSFNTILEGTIPLFYSPPQFISNPHSQLVNIADSVKFECEVWAQRNFEVFWQKDGSSRLPVTAKTIVNTSIHIVTSILTIDKMIYLYQGNYSCVARIETDEFISSEAQLHVIIPCPEIVNVPINTTVTPGDVANFRCLAYSHGSLNYKWRKHQSKELPSSVKVLMEDSTSRCSISKVQPSLEGWYCCEVTNECGSVEECAWLEVDTTPVMTSHPQSLAIKQGSRGVSLKCSAHAYGFGKPHYDWRKYHPSNGRWTRPSNRATGTKSSQLTFRRITEEDEGTYHCIASSGDGRTTSNNATIAVYGPPNITNISSNTVTFEGDQVKMLCSVLNDADAILPVTIVWYNPKGVQLVSDGQHTLNETNIASGQKRSILSLYPVNRTDDGVYTCRVFNDKECYSESKINLTIEYAPIVTLTPPSPHTVFVGEFVPLLCKANGLPAPTVQWFKGDQPVEHVPELYDQVYYVPTKSPHTTVYTCVSKNNAGGATQITKANITVTVHRLCDALPPPKNGYVIPFNDGKGILFFCNSGYKLVGLQFLQCKGGGWEPKDPPMCKP